MTDTSEQPAEQATPAAPTPPAETPSEAAPKNDTPERAFSQSDVERLIGERLSRERAKYADYDDLRQRSEQLKTIEDRDKTEAQRATEEIAAAKWELENTQLELRRFRAANAHGIPEESLSLLTGSTDEEITASAKHLGELVAAKRALDEIKALEKSQNSKPSTGRPADNFRPGASPAETPVVDSDYPESWLPRARVSGR